MTGVHASSHDRLDRREPGARVQPHRAARVDGHGVHLLPGGEHRGDHTVQVVLALTVLAVESRQLGEELAATEREQHDRDLADLPDLGRGVEVLDDLDEPGTAAHDPAVAARIVEHRGGDGGRGGGTPVRGDQAPHVVAGDRIEVATHHEHVVDAADRTLSDLHGMTGAELLRLLHEDGLGRDAPARHLGPHVVGTVAHHHDHLRGLRREARLHHVPERRTPTDRMQHLRRDRPQPLALARREHDQGH